jgi:carboxyl-terminal processing protease
MDIVRQNALEEVDEKKLFEGAMQGMMESLGDEYSSYMPPELQKELDEALDGKFGGIGAHISIDPDTRELVVLMPVLDSPAYKAGMLPGDKLLRIGDRSTQGMTSHDASKLLRGKPGEKVTVTVLHPGQEKPSDLEIARALIHVDTVLGDSRDAKGVWNFFLPAVDKIGYLRITSFSEDTATELKSALETLSEEKMKGLILDLRDNPGGLLDIACPMCDLFLKKGDVIVTTRGRDKNIREKHEATGEGRYTDVPMVILINRDSASASEIFAACMQDHGRATIVGQRTHGKGTVQHVIPLEKDCGAIRMTTSSYWRPSGENINRRHGVSESEAWGVQPDAEGKLVLDIEQRKALALWRIHRDAREGDAPPDDAQALRAADLQLDKAIECLLKK